MSWQSLLVALPLVFCAPLENGATSDALLPLPKNSIALAPASDNLLTLEHVLQRLSAATGVTFSYESTVASRLAVQRVQLSQRVVLSPDDAYPWIEGLLTQNGFELGIVSLEGEPLVGVYAELHTAHAGAPRAKPVAHFVSEDRIEECRRHPALRIQTVIDMGPEVDVRTLGNILRGLTENDDVSSVIPVANTNSVVVVGSGLRVANLVALLQEVRTHASTDPSSAGK